MNSSTILYLISGLVFGYIVSTLIESIFHQKMSDAPRKSVSRWEKYRLLAPLVRANYSHHIIHHKKTFRHDYITQFRNTEEKKSLDGLLSRRGKYGKLIQDSNYANKLHGTGALSFIAPFLPMLIVLYFLSDLAFFIGFFICSTISPLFNNYVHPYLHMKHSDAMALAYPPMRWFLRTAYYRKMSVNHYLHHKYMVCNFNLMLGGDWLREQCRILKKSERNMPKRRIYRSPFDEEMQDMQKLGLPVLIAKCAAPNLRTQEKKCCRKIASL